MSQSLHRSRIQSTAVLFLSTIVLLASFLSGPAQAQGATPPGITWAHDRTDPHWVQGQVNVNASPDAVWARVADVPNWPKLLTDIKWLKVLDKGKDRWRVKLETRTFECGAHEYKVMLLGGRALTFEIDAPGIDSKARVVVRPGASPSQANIVYSLYVRATGIMGWFISEKQLRGRQEAMVIRALTDIQRTFGAVPSP